MTESWISFIFVHLTVHLTVKVKCQYDNRTALCIKSICGENEKEEDLNLIRKITHTHKQTFFIETQTGIHVSHMKKQRTHAVIKLNPFIFLFF